MDKDSYFFMKGNATKSFDKIKVISDPTETASDSVVIVLVKGRQQFIMKLTFVENARAVEYNAQIQSGFYRIMKHLLRRISQSCIYVNRLSMGKYPYFPSRAKFSGVFKKI